MSQKFTKKFIFTGSNGHDLPCVKTIAVKLILTLYYDKDRRPYKADIWKKQANSRYFHLLDQNMTVESQGAHAFCRIRINSDSPLHIPYTQGQLVLMSCSGISSGQSLLQLHPIGCTGLSGIYHG